MKKGIFKLEDMVPSKQKNLLNYLNINIITSQRNSTKSQDSWRDHPQVRVMW